MQTSAPKIRPYHWPRATGTTPNQNVPLANNADKTNVTEQIDVRKLRGKLREQLRKSF